MAGARPRRQTACYGNAQSGQPSQPGFLSHHGQRRLGARLLPEVPEPPRRLPEGMVERGELGRGQQALPEQPKVRAGELWNAKGCRAHPFFAGLNWSLSFEFQVSSFEWGKVSVFRFGIDAGLKRPIRAASLVLRIRFLPTIPLNIRRPTDPSSP